MENNGMVAAYLLDGRGGGKTLSWSDIDGWHADDGLMWLHLHRDAENSQGWLREHSGLDPLVTEAILAESTRPRCVQMGNGLMLFLRGVNLNPGADPEDMISIRMWIEEKRVISVRIRRLLSIDDLLDAIDRGHGPRSSADFIGQLVDLMSSRIGDVVTDIEEQLDQLQEQLVAADNSQIRTQLMRLRSDIIALRRHLAPQREALARLTQFKIAWFGELEIMRFREESDRATRYIEELDAARERATVAQEEIANRLSEQLNARMYVLSIVAAIFLPLGFLTGLLGINVGGIPLADNALGFFSVTLGLLGVAGILVVLFRWKKWL